MIDPRMFVEHLEDLSDALSVALRRVRAHRDDFISNASATEMRQFERRVTEVRTCAEELEREFNCLEYLAAKRFPKALRAPEE